MVKFKLPTMGKGSKGKRKVILVSATVSIAVVSVILILYFTNAGFKNRINSLLRIGGKDGDLGPIVAKADTVSFDLLQTRVPPNTEFTMRGQFTDKEGKPVRVKEALFYVIQNATGAAGPRRMLLQGSIGNNIGKFTKTVPTSGFPRGDDYDVIVADHPLTTDEIEGMPSSGASLGIGEALEVGAGKMEERERKAKGSIPALLPEGAMLEEENLVGGMGGIT